MASKSVIPPFSKFSSENEKWSLYSERLEFYFVACGITDDTDKKNYFLAWCGENLFAILTSLFDPVKLKDPSIEYSKIISKLDSQFKEDVNIMSATYNLYMCKQKPGQSAAEWLTELKEKARHCGFESSCVTSTRERALRDLIAMNCSDTRVRQALLKEGDPDLKRAEDIALQVEQLSKDLKQIQPSSAPRHDVAELRASSKRSSTSHYATAHRNKRGEGVSSQYKCLSCGKNNHKRENCKYRNFICNLCHTKGHLQAVCKKNVPDSGAFPGKEVKQHVHAVNSVHNVQMDQKDKPFLLNVVINDHEIDFEVDTGSAVSLIDEHTWQRIGSPLLSSSNVTLKSYTGQSLHLKGRCEIHVLISGMSYLLHFVVVKGTKPPLFGRDSIVKTCLDVNELIRNDSFSTLNVNFCSDLTSASIADQIVTDYSDVFSTELGHCTKFKAKLHLRQDAVPKFHKPRPIPFARMDAVKEEIQRLEANGTLSKTTHSEWAAPIVAVPKPKDRIRICGDFKVTFNPQLKTEVFDPNACRTVYEAKRRQEIHQTGHGRCLHTG